MTNIDDLQQQKANLIERDRRLHEAYMAAAPGPERNAFGIALDVIEAEIDRLSDEIGRREDQEWSSWALGRDERLADIAYYRMGLL